MTDVLLHRTETGPHGTFGTLHSAGWEFQCLSLELPWRNNERSISCIPERLYQCSPWNSARFPNTYLVEDVEGRTGILTHTGNLAGDVEQGLKTHSLGCILMGDIIGYLGGQKAVLKSAVAFNRFRRYMGRNRFQLMIRWGKDHV